MRACIYSKYQKVQNSNLVSSDDSCMFVRNLITVFVFGIFASLHNMHGNFSFLSDMKRKRNNLNLLSHQWKEIHYLFNKKKRERENWNFTRQRKWWEDSSYIVSKLAWSFCCYGKLFFVTATKQCISWKIKSSEVILNWR